MKIDKKEILSMMFCDVVGFSKIGNDNLYSIVEEHIRIFIESKLNQNNSVYSNTWGDGILICSHDPQDLLELALSIDAWFRNKNWIREGFSRPLILRIGLHTEKVNIVYEDSSIKSIIGQNVNTAARIEPIVEEGKIYCSELFYQHTKNEAQGFVTFNDLGEKQLAKSFGIMHLYEILKNDNKVDKPIIAKKDMGLKIKKEFTDLEKHDYLDQLFQTILTKFSNNLDNLKKVNENTDYRIKNIRSDKFTCHFFIYGKLKADCQIWIGSNFQKVSVITIV
jgi:class 3 adenylate cyclase